MALRALAHALSYVAGMKWLGLVVLALLIGAAAVLYQPDLPMSQLRPKYADSTSTFVDIELMQVHVRDERPRDEGLHNKLPVVMLHGTGASLHTWDAWANEIKYGRRVVRIDLPGFGLTGPFVGDDYSMPHYVSALGALLNQLGIDKAILLGNSFGGHVAWRFAVAHPARVAGLVLEDAAGYPVTVKSAPIAFQVAQIGWLQPINERILPRSLIESSVRNVYADPSKVTEDLITRYFELSLREGNRHAVIERLRQVPHGTDADQIKQVTAPTLILWGKEDRLYPPTAGQLFHGDIAGSELVILDGVGHVPHEENPTLSLPPVQRFLAAH